MLPATTWSTSSGWIRPFQSVVRASSRSPPAADEVDVSVVDEVAHPVDPGHPHHHRRRVGDPPEALLALAQRPLGGAPLGHVLDHRDEADHGAVAARPPPRHILGLQRARPLGRMVVIGDEQLRLPGQRLLDHRQPLGIAVLAPDLAHRPPQQLRSRIAEIFGERLVEEAQPKLAVDVGDHDRQQVGQRQHAGRREHLDRHAGRQVRGRAVVGRRSAAPFGGRDLPALVLGLGQAGCRGSPSAAECAASPGERKVISCPIWISAASPWPMADLHYAPWGIRHAATPPTPTLRPPRLLDFEPVPRLNKRKDGWTPPLQRQLIALLAATGSPSLAAEAMGKNRFGAEKLYKTPGAASFRAAWDAAVALFEERSASGAAQRIAATGPLKPPGIDRRRSASGPAGREPDLPEDEEEISEEQKLELIERIGNKFLRKVVAERQARLNGEIAAADFYLRQITCLEVMFDMTSSEMGFNPWAVLGQLQRGGHSLAQIAETPFTRKLDAHRREYWSANGEPMRPYVVPRGYLEDHGDHSTEPGNEALGKCTAPPPGVDAEAWQVMGNDEQRRVRQEVYDRAAGGAVGVRGSGPPRI